MRGVVFGAVLLALPNLAGADDRGYLTAFLEDNLSGAGRQVVITGFEGALSSQAKIAEMTIADDQGVWLTLSDVVLDWNRTALLSGNVSVNELSAGKIVVARLPSAPAAATKPEAGSFALPELPVSIDITHLAAREIDLGPEVLGQAVIGQLEASLNLSGGEGAAKLALTRLDDGPEGEINLTASYSNAQERLAINLVAREGADGIAASLLDLPGKPAAALEISGEGPFRDFSAKVALSTDGTDRLAGTVAVTALSDTSTGFSADLAGDLAPLFVPEYAAFFGNSITLRAAGERHADGRLNLPTFALKAKAIDLSGHLALRADGSPQDFGLTGSIAQDSGAPVLLPLTTDLPVQIGRADVALAYDRAKGEGWTASAQITGFDRPDFRVSNLGLSGSGRIGATAFGGNLRFAAEGLDPSDAALARALGSVLSGEAVFYRETGSDLTALPRLVLNGEDYAARITGLKIAKLADGLPISGQLTATMDDLSRLSDLIGQPLGGAGEVSVAGQVVPLTGAFDLKASIAGTDLRAGIPELDRLLQGTSQVQADLRRDAGGVTLNSLTVSANRLNASAKGQLSTANSDLSAQIDLPDLAVLGSNYGGGLSATAAFKGGIQDGTLKLEALGKGLRMGQPDADRLLAGQSRVTAQLRLTEAGVLVERAELKNGQLSAQASGSVNGAVRDLKLSGELANLALLVPDFPGALKLSGTVRQDAQGALLDVAGNGPGGIQATVKGRLAPDFQSGDLTIKGQAQAALANSTLAPRALSGTVGFDLRLNGPLALNALSGSVNLADGRLADPALTFALEGMSAKADLAAGQARLAAKLPVSTGGAVQIMGTVGLAEPFSGALGVVLSDVILRDPDLYETRINGEMKVAGPLAGGAEISGRLTLGTTELRVPSTGFGGSGGLPDLRHANEPSEVRNTRARAGLIADASAQSAGSAVAYGLNLTILAPNQIFLRGRGLDAELGGELQLHGSTANVQPAGAFNLIRGRLDILGKRLELDEALLQMEGELVPFLRVVASTENDGITSGVLIEGPANDPKVSFTSNPELPEEEVLAQLLFGQGLQNLSALQALQLANAVATLAGKGGEGVVGRLRQGFGLDNLDVKTAADGGAQVTAGKYITKNVYSEVTVDQTGQSQINLNLDVTKSITLRGKAGSDGQTGLGLFLEKDY